MNNKKIFRNEMITLFVGAFCFFSYLLIFHFILNDSSVCLFKFFIGLPCPTCGMSRSYIYLFSLNFKEAFYYHPLFIIPPILYLIFTFRHRKICKKFFYSRKFWFIISLIFLIVYVIRMILIFPNEPMSLGYGLLFKLFFK